MSWNLFSFFWKPFPKVMTLVDPRENMWLVCTLGIVGIMGTVHHSSCTVHCMVKVYLGYFWKIPADPQCTCNRYSPLTVPPLHTDTHTHFHSHGIWKQCLCHCPQFVTSALISPVFTAVEDLRWPVPPGSLHGVYHRSFYGVSPPGLPETLPRDVALHLRDGVQKGMCSCTHTDRQTHTHPLATPMNSLLCSLCSQRLCNIADMTVSAAYLKSISSDRLYINRSLFFPYSDSLLVLILSYK